MRYLLIGIASLFLLTSCASNPPLTAEEKAQQEAANETLIAYFSKPIEITDDGGSRSHGGIDSLRITGNSVDGRLVKYYRRNETIPFMIHQITYCKKEKGAPMRLFCELYDGQHRWAQLTFEEVDADKVVKDGSLLSLRSPIAIKKGQLELYLRLSPLHWSFAARFKDPNNP